VAAAEVLAAVLQRPSLTLPDDVATWVAEHPGQDGMALVPTALQALVRIERDSELQELWDDFDHAAAWRQSMADLRSRLRG
jgi:hypothetical protein